ncbi:ATP-binding protein [Kordiimonas laminariae]|uniref:ATP-binding protein n=1 Tax=Kordiimonas laminariae TaxID=2917717 RepID=UPI001FF34976|nr:ATP-binding protein [Kordiimonas laminariae]MCK0069801.1 ATP-binding protein [Kordiimonas laminariae]
MESRLPKPIREALLDNEVKSAFKLLAIALSGLFGAGGVSLLAYLFWGSKSAILVGSIILVLTAFTIFRALRNLDDPEHRQEVMDLELLNALASNDRRALLITDVDGTAVTNNYAFEKMAGSNFTSVNELALSEDGRTQVKRLLHRVGQVGQAKDVIQGRGGSVTVSGRRIGRYIVWQAFRDNDVERLVHERASFSRWMEPIFDQLECGVLLEDRNGKPHFLNRVLREWLRLGDEDGVPHKVSLKHDDTQLLVSSRQGIDVEVVDVPLQTRESDRYLGRYRIIRKLDHLRQIALDDSREFLIDPIFDAAPVAIAVVDREGGISEFNQPLKLHAAGKNVAVGDSVLELVKQEDREELQQIIEFAYDGRPSSVPLDIVFNTQPERLGQIYSTCITKGGEPHAILYLIDTTQEKSLERQFVQAQKMQAVGQLAGGVAHDFNNLLTAIIGFCDLLLVRHDAGDQSFSDIIQIKQNANRAANLVRQLLAFSRQQTLRPKVLMLTDILAEISNLIRRLIGENIDLQVVHGRDLLPVKVDQGQLEQVIINLAVNARDAMPEGGKLEIATSMIGPTHTYIDRFDIMTPDDYVLIEVKDTGCGIPKDNLNKIFEPFFTTKSVGQGTGLGLATVYGIVKQTGGFVFVDSEEGRGTSFLVFLKAHSVTASEIEEEKEEEKAAKDLTGKGTILVVEDEAPVRMFACRALSNKGYKVLEADSGEAGLEILQTSEETIDLLISDVIMPTMDGPTLVKEARKDFPDLPVIFVSGYAEDMFRKNLEAEEFQFLPKPFSLNDLAEKVKMMLS